MQISYYMGRTFALFVNTSTTHLKYLFLPACRPFLPPRHSPLSVCNGVESAELYSGVFKSNGHPSHSAHLSANRLALLLLSDIADQINQTDTSSPPLLWSSECHTDCYD